MTVDIIHLSQDGRLIIPKEVTEKLNLSPQDDFLMIGNKESLLLKRIAKPNLKKQASQVMDKFSQLFESHNITPDDIKKEIDEVRRYKCSQG